MFLVILLDMETIKDLTRAEEQIMQVIWEIDRGFIKDFLDKLPEPKPAYNTVSTIVRILEVKGFVSHQAFGKTHQYFLQNWSNTLDKVFGTVHNVLALIKH